jgi:hypothetical protein
MRNAELKIRDFTTEAEHTRAHVILRKFHASPRMSASVYWTLIGHPRTANM